MLERQVFKEQVRIIYALAPLGFVATVMNSAIVFVVMKEVAPPHILAPWLGTVLLITAFRAVLVACFRRADLDREDPAIWARRFTASLSLVGLAWGSIGL